MNNRLRIIAWICSLLSAAAPMFCQAPQPLGSADRRYELRPNDTIDVKFRFTPQYNESAKIAPDGYVTLTLTGDLKLGGLTLQDATRAIQSQAANKVRDPEVSLQLTGYEKPYFIVAGQVANPGHYDMSNFSMSLIEVIAQAGGFKGSSKTTTVYVYHKFRDGLTFYKEINAKELMQTKRDTVDFAIVSGDVIVVPQNRFSSVERVLKIFNLGVYYPLPQ
jgi:polysaccharide export outer membrane protein